MALHPLAGKPAPRDGWIHVPRLISAYYTGKPDPAVAAQQVSFGTSGHRGTSLTDSFNEHHILAVTQAVCEVRRRRNVVGPLFLGKDTHALSEPAFATAVEVFAANGVELMIQSGGGYTPTPVISHAILSYNRGRREGLADGVVITPSHNPPEDGGYKYNPPEGGPADTETTKTIQDRANELMAGGLSEVRRIPYERALRQPTTHSHDYLPAYIGELSQVVDLEAVRESGLHIGIDPMGGSGVAFWEPIAEAYRLNLEVVNPYLDPAFGFMTLDWDGKIRMDCSSPYAMASLVGLRDRFDIAFGNDTDYDRHGIVTPEAGLMNPNHYLAVAVGYLFQNRPGWSAGAAVGKTLVSSSMIDRVAEFVGRRLLEVPVGFKWFVDGLLDGSLGFGGEESAGASFLRRDGTVWTTDKDGFILDLLAAEITARTGHDPSWHYRRWEERFGRAVYERIDAPAQPEQKARFKSLTADKIRTELLAGEKIEAKLTHAPGNGASMGGLKITTASGWFAARPSGTENVYKLYAESFRDRDHLQRIQSEARSILDEFFAS